MFSIQSITNRFVSHDTKVDKIRHNKQDLLDTKRTTQSNNTNMIKSISGLVDTNWKILRGFNLSLKILRVLV